MWSIYWVVRHRLLTLPKVNYILCRHPRVNVVSTLRRTMRYRPLILFKVKASTLIRRWLNAGLSSLNHSRCGRHSRLKNSSLPTIHQASPIVPSKHQDVGVVALQSAVHRLDAVINDTPARNA